MGDRALVQFTDGVEGFSPVIYLHWNGSEVGEWLRELRDLMRGRNLDLAYTAARFVGICHAHIKGNVSLGMWNQEEKLTPSQTHGDFGCVVVDIRTWQAECFGGYGLTPESSRYTPTTAQIGEVTP